MLRTMLSLVSPRRRLWTKFSSSSSGRRALSTSSVDHDDRLIVVGSGVAGSATALVAAETYQIPVTLICAGNSTLLDCNSYWAQGGIIYRNRNPRSQDSAQSLAADIHRAGAGLCQDDAVQKVAAEGPFRVDELLLSRNIDDPEASSPFARVPFDRYNTTTRNTANNHNRLSPEDLENAKYNDDYKLCLEASHNAPRILHQADCTGAAITQELSHAIRRHPNITIVHDTLVTDLAVTQDDLCVGVHCMSRHSSSSNGSGETTQLLRAHRGVVLASGGLAGIYQHTTNPSGFNALGSSVALAARAGQHNPDTAVALSDLEYVQFHPTVLYQGPDQPRFLLTEALRGEGALLRNAHGHCFAPDYHRDAELAPRDVVSRAVFQEAQRTQDWIYLDITHRDAAYLHQRFPTIHAYLQNNTTTNSNKPLDLSRDLLPITPAAHYTCGGIRTDLHGRTSSVRNLYAAGEAARTGLHGGNRLASTSLLEGLVFGASVADHVGSGGEARDNAHAASLASTSTIVPPPSLMSATQGSATTTTMTMNGNSTTTTTPAARGQQMLDTLKKTMWDHVGVVRTRKSLNCAVDVLEGLQIEAAQLPLTWETAAVKDATTAGLQVALAAQANNVSAGAHYLVDDDHNNHDDDDDTTITAAACSDAASSSASDNDSDEEDAAVAVP